MASGDGVMDYGGVMEFNGSFMEGCLCGQSCSRDSQSL
jgi:hypothetical protein